MGNKQTFNNFTYDRTKLRCPSEVSVTNNKLNFTNGVYNSNKCYLGNNKDDAYELSLNLKLELNVLNDRVLSDIDKHCCTC